MPLIIVEDKIDECAREVATRVVAELARLNEMTEARQSVFIAALQEAIPRVRVKLLRWAEQVLNQHPAIELDKLLNTLVASPTTTTASNVAAAVDTADASHFYLQEWTKQDVDNLFIAGKDYTVPVTADYAVPVGTTPLVNKIFGLIVSGLMKYLKAVGNYQPGDVERLNALFETVLDQVKQRFSLTDEKLIPAGEQLI